MNEYRLTFASSTNIALPIGIYDILYVDAYHFGYKKNGNPNISGFLNRLIPSLSRYQDLLHKKLLEYNHGEESITKKVEQCIYNVYLAPFAFKDDAVINVSLRVNKDSLTEFLLIHDKKLNHYNTTFTSYVRSLLVEYALRPLEQREKIFFYSFFDILDNAICKSFLCSFYTTHGEKLAFIPVSIEVSPNSRRNCVIGCSSDREQFIVLPISLVRNIIQSENSFIITDSDCENVDNVFEQFLLEEKEKWLN